jgi:hypothetical protein
MKMSKVKVKYSFVLHTGLAESPLYIRIIPSYLKMSGMPCLTAHDLSTEFQAQG